MSRAIGTFEYRVRADVAEGEADDGRLVQVSSDRRLERQETRQIPKHLRLHPASPPGCLAADRPATKSSLTSEIHKDLIKYQWQSKLETRHVALWIQKGKRTALCDRNIKLQLNFS